ncbi:MAG: hypothetical protein Q4E65_02650 [Clostridia bacterium]|nr:hypothetical protein [Clostridia bacterium]
MPDTIHDPAKDEQDIQGSQADNQTSLAVEVALSYVEYSKDVVKAAGKQVQDARQSIVSAREYLKNIEAGRRRLPENQENIKDD